MPLSVIVKIWTFIVPLIWKLFKIAFSLDWVFTLFENPPKASAAAKKTLNVSEPRNFDSIPGPWPSLPIIGTQWLYMWFGPYQLHKLHFANEDKYAKYGAIVKEHYLWNYPIVHLYDKNDIEEVLKYPSKFPLRPALEAQCIYRKSHPERYKSVGLVNAQGLEWQNLRSKLISDLARPTIIEHTIKQTNIIADQFIDQVRCSIVKDSNTVPLFERLIYRFTLEGIVAIVLDQQLGSLRDEDSPMVEKLMLDTDKLFEVCHDTMYGLPLWKYFPSKAYNQLVECEDIIYDVFAGYVEQAMKKMPDYNSDLGHSILKRIVAAEGVDIRDKIATLIDIVSGGIDSTGNAIIFLLFNILSNERARTEVYREVDEVLSTGTLLTTEILQQMPYLKACVIESLRLSPVAPNVARLLEKDFVFQNYHVPAGTLVVCETGVVGWQEHHYENPRQFFPEGGMEGGRNKILFFPVPLGVGGGRCRGKGVADQEMRVVRAKLLQNFDIEFLEPLETIYKFLISPKGPVKVTVKDRF
uniref:Cytochrome P450 314 family n=2 Tax=Protostomia TaxID=33317 RepID=A0A6B7GB98_9CRUS|nr:cytochrome P450 314 family [Diaphanosoma celebensis]